MTTLVPVLLPGDSTLLRAVFECDSTNKVLMTDIEELKTRNVNTELKFMDGKLVYATAKGPDTVFVRSDTIRVETEREIPVEVEVEKEVNRLTTWQRVRIKVGDVALLVLAVLLGYKAVRTRFKL